MPLRPWRHAGTVTALTVAAGLLAACGSAEPTSGAPTRADDGHYPVTIENCGDEVTFEAEPRNVVMLKSAWVPYLDALGVLDHVSAKAGAYPEGYYDDDTTAEVAAIESLTDRLDTSGHLLISKEAVVEREPDLVLGHIDNLDRASLGAVGIPMLEVGGLCPKDAPQPSFDEVYAEMRDFGRVFHRDEEAEQAVAALQERVAEVTRSAPKGDPGTGEPRTAAVLYPTVGGGTTYAYGNRSMADPQLEAAGLRNVYADVAERVFEVTTESLLAEDPDVLVLLHSDGDPAQVEEAITRLPGAARLTAVREGDVITQLFNFTEPPSPLAVDGLERIIEHVAGTP